MSLAIGCDALVDPSVISQAVLLNPTTIEAPVGAEVNLDDLLGLDVGMATGGAPIARVAYRQQEDDWFASCFASGTSSIKVYAKQGAELSEKTLFCKEPQPIEQYIGHWLNLNRYFNAASVQVQFYGDASDLEYRTDRGGLEIRCTAIGTYRYLIVTLPDFPARWYVFECLQGMPLAPIPAPRIGIPVNLSEAFRDQGLIVQAVQVWPLDLAQAVNVNASISGKPQPDVRLGSSTIAGSFEAPDIHLLCKREGVGRIKVSFDVSDEPEYRVICHAAHDQGGGG